MWDNVSSDAKDLILRMLDRNVSKRLTVEECIEHCWIKVWNGLKDYIYFPNITSYCNIPNINFDLI